MALTKEKLEQANELHVKITALEEKISKAEQVTHSRMHIGDNVIVKLNEADMDYIKSSLLEKWRGELEECQKAFEAIS